MQITVNGERRDVAGPCTVEALLQELTLDPRLVVVEHNRRILKRPDVSHVTIQAGDQLEIIRIVGGGSSG